MYNNEFKNKMFIFNKMIECGLDFNENILEISADATGEKYSSLLEMFPSNNHNNYLFSKKYNKEKAVVIGEKGILESSIHCVIPKKENGLYLNLEPFNTIISYNTCGDVLLIPSLYKNMYIGCLFDTNDKLADEYRGIYDVLYFAILMKVSNDYEMIKDEYKKLNKEMRLIYRKKI